MRVQEVGCRAGRNLHPLSQPELLTYAVGRKLNSSDRPSIDAIQREMKTTEAGLRDLIQAVVLSEMFFSELASLLNC